MNGRNTYLCEYEKKINEISNIPQTLKAYLLENFNDEVITIIKTQTSSDGTKKFLYKLSDENIIEGVLMQYKYGYT